MESPVASKVIYSPFFRRASVSPEAKFSHGPLFLGGVRYAMGDSLLISILTENLQTPYVPKDSLMSIPLLGSGLHCAVPSRHNTIPYRDCIWSALKGFPLRTSQRHLAFLFRIQNREIYCGKRATPEWYRPHRWVVRRP